MFFFFQMMTEASFASKIQKRVLISQKNYKKEKTNKKKLVTCTQKFSQAKNRGNSSDLHKNLKHFGKYT